MKPHDMRPHASPGGSRRRRPPVIATRRMVALTGGLCASPGGMVLIRHLSAGSAGSGSPLLYSTGDIQVNNVSGTSSGSQIAGMEGLNTILIKDSTLESTVTGKTASDPIATASSSTSPPRATRKPASASTPRSSRSIPHSAPPIGSGSMFYFTNTTADVVLQNNTELDFDTGAVTLTDNAAAGSGTGTASDVPITVNVDGTSTWVVTKDTTISALNVASGGDGNAVTIVANGKTVVSGSGDVTVTVTGSYSTSVSAGSDTELSSDTIDRSEFDSRFGTSTARTMA